MATSKAKATTPAAEKPAKTEPAAKVFHATRGFTQGEGERYFAPGSKTTIGAKKDDVSQANAESFVASKHGRIE